MQNLVYSFYLTVFVSKIFLDVRLETDGLQSQRWIRKYFDADGYFLLQRRIIRQGPSVQKIDRRDMFLTADGVSSLTIKGTKSHFR